MSHPAQWLSATSLSLFLPIPNKPYRFCRRKAPCLLTYLFRQQHKHTTSMPDVKEAVQATIVVCSQSHYLASKKLGLDKLNVNLSKQGSIFKTKFSFQVLILIDFSCWTRQCSMSSFKRKHGSTSWISEMLLSRKFGPKYLPPCGQVSVCLPCIHVSQTEPFQQFNL